MGELTLTTRGHWPRWYRLDTVGLYKLWLGQYPSEGVAIAHAIWFGNITTRDKAQSTRFKYESIRDRWVKDYTQGGRSLGLEPVPCYLCRGTGWTFGDNRKPVQCAVCDKGVYEHRLLYMHLCVVEGYSMYIKSYTKPQREERGLPEWEGFDVDGPSILPMTALMRMLSYVAVVKLDMLFIKGRYRPRVFEGG